MRSRSPVRNGNLLEEFLLEGKSENWTVYGIVPARDAFGFRMFLLAFPFLCRAPSGQLSLDQSRTLPAQSRCQRRDAAMVFGFIPDAVRIPSGICVQIRRNPQL
jgi:hypothetical protein